MTKMAEVRPDRSVVRVAVVLVLVYAVGIALIWFADRADMLEPLMDGTANVAGGCLHALGVPAAVEGNDIVESSRILRIDPDCTGLAIAWMYVALIVAYPLPLKWRAAGLLAGLPAVFAANMGRLVAVGYLSERLNDDAFYFVHDYLFKVFMVGVILALWATYLGLARQHAR